MIGDGQTSLEEPADSSRVMNGPIVHPPTTPQREPIRSGDPGVGIA